jgi:hypothetical protein
VVVGGGRGLVGSSGIARGEDGDDVCRGIVGVREDGLGDGESRTSVVGNEITR